MLKYSDEMYLKKIKTDSDKFSWIKMKKKIQYFPSIIFYRNIRKYMQNKIVKIGSYQLEIIFK